jgi:hypothetical protein
VKKSAPIRQCLTLSRDTGTTLREEIHTQRARSEEPPADTIEKLHVMPGARIE